MIMTGENQMPVAGAQPAWDFERFYTLRDREAVREFVAKHPFLGSLLSEAYGRIQDHFSGSEVFLQHVVDPEIEDYEELVAFIGTNLPPTEALDRLKRFNHEWWLDAMDRAQDKLSVSLEFR